LDDLRQTMLIQGENATPQIEFFRAHKQKTRAGAGFDRNLLWFHFLFQREKENETRNKIPCEPPKRYL
jgi:hypothetical protein